MIGLSIYDTIIIGGGPAGLCAGLYLARGGYDALLLEGGFIGGQASLTSDIENYPGFENGISGIDLAMKMEEQAKRFGLKTEYTEVKSAELSGDVKKILTSDGELRAKTVIIASGASPRKLGLPNEESLVGSGVSYCATCDGAFFRGADVAVIGGGNTAAEDAIFLSKIANKVYIIHRRDNLRAEQSYKNKISETPNIEVVYNSKISRIIEKDGAVGGIEIDKNGDGTHLSVRGVFVAIGTVPKSGLFTEAEKDENGYIITDENMKTSIGGVFAAGDIRRKPLRQVVTAVSDGAVAANSAMLYLSGGIV